ncbi:hypothetical protein BGW36DRAFT_370494 [Talaromyces proteolyticus]|uniref:Uncharacterized protein n=1 Tax=Talaromyces proteolyticus TaxID=1131652 RepID=A0AAD4L1Y7_9EURO|nr:uncharacterized protein BGW36DRAFT_370494 [Talaromyces proteolyticus]KAH8704055.1 hypothetical protein BGW36DRAFT_370494 [Talaromyces proteolyticus]
MAESASFANPESLTVLSDAVNQTLIDTGRFFKTSGSIYSRAQLKTSIPASYERFQTALDNLSEQIFIAKAFLEKDYEGITAKRTAPKAEPVHPPAEDVAMSEAPPAVVDEPAEDIVQQPDLPEPPIKTEAAVVSEVIPLQTTETEQEQPDATAKIDNIKQDNTINSSNQELPVTTADDLNFDSMISTDGGNGNEFDLNFNFGNDDIGNQNFLEGTNFLPPGTAMAEGTSNNDPGPNSISSLLPGLESYAVDNNAGGDFNLELQKLEQPSVQEDMLVPGESSFDDLFLEKDHLEGEDNLLSGDGLMELGELDENWF